ncbi:MAG: anti-sigma factor [Burkholderiaceae bacterium]|nr:anti-sigma factor [Burkholderiaceae bacterium]
MNCTEAANRLNAYADGEIGTLQRLSIEQHLRACPACARAHRELLVLRARVRDEVQYFQAPSHLYERVQALATAQATARERAAAPVPVRVHPRAAPLRWGWLTGAGALTDRWRWIAQGALAGCAATVIGWVGGGALLDWNAGRDIVAQAVATHGQATLNGRLIEVASSDQHTVKPWLSAHLDYSPPVQDLVNEGFPLLGGRVEQIRGQRVAVLVYRYRQHTIDVYVWPTVMAIPTSLHTVRGLHVEGTSGAGMQWLAVSDVSPDVLTQFVERLARADRPPSDALPQ